MLTPKLVFSMRAAAFTCELWVRPSMESKAGLRIVSEVDAFGPRTVLVSKKLATCTRKHTTLAPSRPAQ